MPEIVSRQQKDSQLGTIRTTLAAVAEKVRTALPAALKDRVPNFLQGAMLCLEADPKTLAPVAFGDLDRFKNLVILAARMGLELGPTMGADAHLIVFKEKGVPKIQLIPNYRGLLKVAFNTGVIDSINSGCVHEGDSFNWDEGSSPFVSHKKGRARGDVTHAWASIRLKGSSWPTIEVLTAEEIEQIRRSAPGANAPAWVNWFDEQARKSALKRCLKTIPRSPDLATALDIDDSVSAGKDAPMTHLGTFGPEPGDSEPEKAPQKPQEAPTQPEAPEPSDEDSVPLDVLEQAGLPMEQVQAPSVPASEESMKTFRSQIAMRLKGLGVNTDELRSRFLFENFGAEKGLTGCDSATLVKIDREIRSKAGAAAVTDWAEKARKTS